MRAGAIKPSRRSPSAAAAHAPSLDAIAGTAGKPSAGDITYTEVGPVAKPVGRDMRADQRRRTRLRSGKIVDLRNRFLCDCLLHDRSHGGLRVRLVQDVALPPRIRIYDDEAHGLIAVDIVWRRGRDLGIRMHVAEPAHAAAMDTAAALALGKQYYALGNARPRPRPIKSR
jgi:hypothetical protein